MSRALGKVTMHGNVTNLLGRTFGRWTVQSQAASDEYNRARWNCKCSCGTEKIVYGSHLKKGESTGCMKCRPGRVKAGWRDSALYVRWMSEIESAL